MAFSVDLTGSILDRRYRITNLLGKGGMGHVYEAVHVALDQRVAVKVLHPRYAYEERFRERFLQEARAASKIRHRNVVEIKDFGETPDGSVYFVMEYLHGHDVGAELQARSPLPWARTRNILLQAASALQAAHAKHIIHRDIKPGNCFLIADEADGVVDEVKLLDFGIAKVSSDSHADAQGKGLTGTGEVFGTASYMSPEQARGETLDARSDMYSLGIMAYEMLVGQVPFTGVNAIHVITRHLRDRPEPLRTYDPKIPAAVESLVLKMIAKAPRDRYASLAEVEQALREIPEDAGARKTQQWRSQGNLRAMVAAKKAASGGGQAAGPGPKASGGAAGRTEAGTDAERTAVVPGASRSGVRAVGRKIVMSSRAPAERTATPAAGGAASPRGPWAKPEAPEAGGVAASDRGRGASAAPAAPSIARPDVESRVESPSTVPPVETTAPAVGPAAPAFGATLAATSVPFATPSSRQTAPPGPMAGSESVGWAPPPSHSEGLPQGWSPSTASTGPHGLSSDTGSETKPHPLERTGAPGASLRFVLVVVGLVLLVGGGSALVTMAVLTGRGEAQGEPSQRPPDAAEPVPTVPAHAVEPEADDGSSTETGKVLAGEDEAVQQPTQAARHPSMDGPAIDADGPATGGSGDMGSGNGAAGDAANGGGAHPPKTVLSARPRSEPHETEKCAVVRKRAIAARNERDWDGAAKLADQKLCWAPAEQEARRGILVRALLEAKRFEECVAAASRALDPQTIRLAGICRSKVQ